MGSEPDVIAPTGFQVLKLEFSLVNPILNRTASYTIEE
jgi:hypothetical protein